MSLNEELKLLHASILDSLPSELRSSLLDENRKLFSNFLEEKAIKPGERVPDVFFITRELKKIKLAELIGDKHLVLSFFRGTWCPYCNLELKALDNISHEIKKRGARLVSSSPELFQNMKHDLDRNGIQSTVVSDLNNNAADKFGLVFDLPWDYQQIYRAMNIHLDLLNNNPEWTLPVPATFVISRDGIIKATHINVDYTLRMEPEAILSELDRLE